jgi:hypothetical protein
MLFGDVRSILDLLAQIHILRGHSVLCSTRRRQLLPATDALLAPPKTMGLSHLRSIWTS